MFQSARLAVTVSLQLPAQRHPNWWSSRNVDSEEPRAGEEARRADRRVGCHVQDVSVQEGDEAAAGEEAPGQNQSLSGGAEAADQGDGLHGE